MTIRCGCCGRRASSPGTTCIRPTSWSRPRRGSQARLEIVSAERIRDELDKLLTLDHPAAGLFFIHETGIADHFLPELPAMRLEHDPIHRHKDVLTHTIAVVENVRPPHEQPPGRPPFDFRRSAVGGAVPRHRQAAHPRIPTGQGHDVPPSRRGRGAHDAQADGRAALLEGRHRCRQRAGRAPPAVPHVPPRVDRLGCAALRPRRRRSAQRAERVDPV